MKREEEIINEAVDYSFIEDNFIEYDDCGDICDDRCFIQKAFESGAKWADETMIDKACEWLFKNTYKGVDDSRVYTTFTYTVDMIEDFRKAMEE